MIQNNGRIVDSFEQKCEKERVEAGRVEWEQHEQQSVEKPHDNRPSVG